jgi:hypothetical protein
MVRITIQEEFDSIEMTLEGNVAGQLVAELSGTWLQAAPHLRKKMLRITVHEDEETVGMEFEGRIAGPWVAEISRAWAETAPRLGQRKLSLDLRNVTYSDSSGAQALREIYSQADAELIVGTLWAQYLADEIKNANPVNEDEEPRHGYDS